MTHVVTHVGKEVRRLREEKGWSQAKLGVESGLGPSGISQIETGRRNPSAASLQRIAEALGVEVRDLFPLGQAPLPDLGEERRGEGRHIHLTVRDRVEIRDSVKIKLEQQFNALIHELEISGQSEAAAKVANVRDEVLAA